MRSPSYPGLSLPANLAQSLGSDGIVLEEDLGDYSVDGVAPRLAVRPTHRHEIVEIVRWAAEEGLAIVPRGGGTQIELGNIPARYDVALDLSRFNRVVDYQPADLTATVEAGITLAGLQRHLASGGKTLPLEAPLSGSATIGGILATGASGPMRASYGLPRDWLIGISVVGGTGIETKSGGKVVKNVTGYDLGKLYTGSMGTLGIIVEATFKLNPLPQRLQAFTGVFPSVASAIEAANGLSGQVYAPQGIQVVGGGIPLSPPLGKGDTAMLAAFVSGRVRAVERRLSEGADFLRANGASPVQELDETAGRKLLESVTDLGWERDSGPCLVLKAAVPPSMTGRVLSLLPQALEGLPEPGIVADPGFGLVRLMWQPDVMGDGDASVVVGAVDRVRALARSLGGSAVVECGPLAVKRLMDVWGGEPEGVEIMRRIKEKLDLPEFSIRAASPGVSDGGTGDTASGKPAFAGRAARGRVPRQRRSRRGGYVPLRPLRIVPQFLPHLHYSESRAGVSQGTHRADEGGQRRTRRD